MKQTIIIFLSIFLVNNNLFAQDEVFSVVEEMPVFTKACDSLLSLDEKVQCSILAIKNYTARVKYPIEALDKDIQGKVYVSFIVEKDGSIGEVTLLRGTNKYLDKEAIEHIKNMPKFFKPGFQNNKAVRVKYNIPINFILHKLDYNPYK